MNTNDKGSIGLTATLASLAKLGYTAFLPVSEHSIVDVIAYKDDVIIRLQVKYSVGGMIKNYSVYTKKTGVVKKEYDGNDFDYYAIYIPEVDKVCYVPIGLGGRFIRWKAEQLTTNNQDVLWFEDYLGIQPTHITRKTSSLTTLIKRIRPDRRKPRPPKEELEKLLLELPATEIAPRYNVSDRAIGKWAKEYGIITKPRGFWTGKNASVV